MVLESGSTGGGGTGGEAAGVDKFKNTTSSSGGSQVYMGTQNIPTYQHGAPGNVRTETSASPYYLGLQEAYNQFNLLNGKQLRDFLAAGQVAGQLQDDAGFIEGQKFWKKLVDASAGLTAAGRNISPMDVLAMYLGKGPLGAKGGGVGGGSVWQVQYRGGRKFLVNSQTGQVKYQGPRFETTYQKSIDLTDPVTAKAIATSVFQQLMHRDPGKGEMGSFADALHSAEQNSPVVTNTTTEYDMNTGEAIGQTSKSSGGVSADAKQYIAQQKVKGNKEYGAIQASTTYENALENAIFNNPFGGA